ncbi:OmpA family protein [Paraburkholderia phymatum]|uniref:OmpA/MotB domain protein n=1 Tax=Paraburkholderia phymatum (strain DSM 17167 / CIP 108236 / LMG 21445 / STM815) TaxID=391038 RepID=B2JJQ4_PARP8|nr:OmpA family protein [Paraburkholderia phymatum]ACC72252.1 OmpA/MotB domain protein [Paraburkholderia phymatum STM815]
MFLRIFTATACAAAIAGCTAYSGPTRTTDIVTLSNGSQAYRVQCLGLLESSKACMDEVKRICGDKPATRVSSIDHITSDLKSENDPREITFQCSTPVVQQPIPPAPAAVVTPVAAPLVAPAPVHHAPVRKITLQGDATFAVGSATLTPFATAKLDDFVAANQGVDVDRLTIAGYTDSTGSAELNNRLSAARARSVQGYLATAGLRASAWDVQGYGSASPVAPNKTAIGRAKNRRVEIQVDGK